ncbi:MAG: LysM peptidoglycan-binding domain-containing protein [Planctomycetota bacterium]
MAVSKELTLATLVLLGCLAVLLAAWGPRDDSPDPAADSSRMASNDTSNDVSEARTMPPGADTSGIRREEVRREDVIPDDELPSGPGAGLGLPPPRDDDLLDPDDGEPDLSAVDIDDDILSGDLPGDLGGDLLGGDGQSDDTDDGLTRVEPPPGTGRDDEPPARDGALDLDLDVDEDVERSDSGADSSDGGAARAAATSEQRHVVARGDTLGEISQKYYGTSTKWRAIRDANDVDPIALVEGTRLKIPALSGVVADAMQGQRIDGGRRYVVKRGESYWTIARDVLGNAQHFRELVDLNDIDAYALMPGDVISLPAPGSGPTRASGGDRVTVPPGAKTHVVQPGEVLGDISQRYYGTSKRWRDIAAANNIADPGLLQAGARIVIPDLPGLSASGSASSSSRSRASDQGGGRQHTVASGDTLGAISQRYYGTDRYWERIRDANPGVNPMVLPIGHSLVIPEIAGTGPAGDAASDERGPPSRSGGGDLDLDLDLGL